LNETTGLITWADRQDFFEPELAAASSEAVQTFTVVENGEKLALEVYTGASGWGVGFDLQNSFFNFQVGDKIKITGKVTQGTAAPMFASATAGAGETHIATVGGDGSFEIDVTLTQANVSAIRTASGDSPAAFRIGAKPAGVRFVIYDIEIVTVDYVPEGFNAVESIHGVPDVAYVGVPLDLNEATIQPSLAAVGRTIVWSKQDPNAGTATYTLEDGVLTATAEGTALITATVAGGAGEEGEEDYVENFLIDIEAAATALTITVAGVEQQVTLVPVGTATVDIFTDGSGYQYSNNAGGYDSSWVKFAVNLGSNPLNLFERVTFTLKGISGDAGYKPVGLLAAGTLPASFSSDPTAAPAPYLVTELKGNGVSATGTANMSLRFEAVKTSTVTANLIEVSINLRTGANTVFEISDIVFVLGTLCDCCSNDGICDNASACDGDCCCVDCLGSCSGCELECMFCGQMEPCDCTIVSQGNLAAPFQKAGDPVVTKLANGAGIGIQIPSNQAGWGGVDFRFPLQEGDVIKISAISLGTPGANNPEFMFQVNTANSAGWSDQQIGNPAFPLADYTLTITAAHMAKIPASGADGYVGGGFRIRFNNNPTPATMLISSFTVTRGGSVVFDLADW